VIRPLGYPLFLRLLSLLGDIHLVPLVQHAIGLAAGVLIYAVLRRLGARPWVAALGAAPLMLDGYQVYLEHFVMAETLFEVLVVSAFALLLWRRVPGAGACAAAGGLLAAAALTRSVGLLLLVPALGYLTARRVGALRLVCAAATGVTVLGSYALWFRVEHDSFALQAYSGYFLAGRVEPFADCAGITLSDLQRPLCDARPRTERRNADRYVWDPDSPLRRLDGVAVSDRNRVAAGFARQVIRHQPGDYLRVVGGDTLRYLSPGRTDRQGSFPVAAWQFRTEFSPDPWQPIMPPPDPYVSGWTWPGPSVSDGVTIAAHGFDLARVRPAFGERAATALARYQRLGFTDGPLLAAGLLLGLLAGAGRLRPPGQGRPDQRRLRHAGALCSVAGLSLLIGPAATSVFDYRYLLPTLVVLPPAGAIGLTLLLERRRDRARPRGPSPRGPSPRGPSTRGPSPRPPSARGPSARRPSSGRTSA